MSQIEKIQIQQKAWINISKLELSESKKKEIYRLLSNSRNNPPQLQDIWSMMDQVWDELGCDNINPDPLKISLYYKHPIWVLNALFIEQDETSLKHRLTIATWVADNCLTNILDFGGGMGTLAIMLTQANAKAQVDVYEPEPSQYALKKIEAFENIKFVDTLSKQYDCLIATDVLEHIPDPLESFAQMIQAVKLEGYLLIANHFYPSIKCHLPSTFHFRYTFDGFAKEMGLKRIGLCKGSHAVIYKKVSNQHFDWKKLRKKEANSKRNFKRNYLKDKYFDRWLKRMIIFMRNPKKTLIKIQERLNQII